MLAPDKEMSKITVTMLTYAINILKNKFLKTEQQIRAIKSHNMINGVHIRYAPGCRGDNI